MTFTGVLNKTGSFSSSSVTKHIQKPPTILAACTDLAKMYHVVGSMHICMIEKSKCDQKASKFRGSVR